MVICLYDSFQHNENRYSTGPTIYNWNAMFKGAAGRIAGGGAAGRIAGGGGGGGAAGRIAGGGGSELRQSSSFASQFFSCLVFAICSYSSTVVIKHLPFVSTPTNCTVMLVKTPQIAKIIKGAQLYGPTLRSIIKGADIDAMRAAL